MKRFPAFGLSLFLGIGTHSVGAEPAGYEVHEWGTFTFVSGSDGTPLQWWQSPVAPASDLPGFVKNHSSGFKSSPSFMRMETPVLYFYPDAPMTVQVSATMQNGAITEMFPAPVHPAAMGTAMWRVRLLPPGDTDIASKLNPVADARGAHYGHARAVPGAWLVQSATGADTPSETEKFIFYRGFSNSPSPYRAGLADDPTFSLTTSQPSPAIETAFAVRTSGVGTTWARLPALAAFPTPASPAPPAVHTTLDKANASSQNLAEALTASLTAAGLNVDEAKAMVATWRDHWFQEPGTRILAILPQAWVDSVLPLNLEPKPRKVTRVFLARFEILSPAVEKELLALLGESDSEPLQPDQIARFKALNLGRFASAGLARAQNLSTYRMHSRFALLQRTVTGP